MNITQIASSKKILQIGCLMVAALTGSAQLFGAPPELMAFQGYLTDANGVVLGTPNPANFNVQFRIFDAEQDGTLLWEEQQTVTVDNGHFSVLLGEGSTVGSSPRPPISTVFKSSDSVDRYVEIGVETQVGAGYNTIQPRLRLLSSPYAFLSSQTLALVDNSGLEVVGTDLNGVRVTGQLQTDTLQTGDLQATTLSGTFTGTGANITDINAANITTGNIAEDRLPSISATKLYGTIADGNLSTNVAKLNTEQTFNADTWFGTNLTANNFFTNYATIQHSLSSPSITATDLSVSNSLFFSGSSDPKISIPSFGQHFHFGSNAYGLGYQSSALYFRSANSFAWFKGGKHTNSFLNPGLNGQILMALTTTGSPYSPWGTGPGIVFYRDKYNDNLTLDSFFGNFGSIRRTLQHIEIHGGQMGNGILAVTYDGDTNWDWVSDRRVKDNIVDAEPMLERALSVRFRRFQYIGDKSEKVHLGVVAQELEESLPELVTTEPTGEKLKRVAYTDFGIVALKALQELADRQESENQNLREENSRLAKRLEQLEERFDNQADTNNQFN